MSIDALSTMQAKDVINARLAMAYVTVNGNRYKLFQAKKITANFKKDKKEVGILGRVNKGHKSGGGEGTGSMTIYQNTALFTDMMKTYKDTGEDIYFDLQLINSDPTSDAGDNITILKDCNLDEIGIASADADGDWLEQDVDFTFEDWENPTKFKELDGMKA